MKVLPQRKVNLKQIFFTTFTKILSTSNKNSNSMEFARKGPQGL